MHKTISLIAFCFKDLFLLWGLAVDLDEMQKTANRWRWKGCCIIDNYNLILFLTILKSSEDDIVRTKVSLPGKIIYFVKFIYNKDW